ncbi:MAG: ParB/RepB/Spo0J family partition protein [bacterium]|nr:ParB/RepB/Spo0J family partition protein [bacterium]
MQLQFHQLRRRFEHLRARDPARQRRLLASLAESGQQTPIVVVAAANQSERYLVIDGHQRIAALQQLGRDTVEAVVWEMSEAEALVLERSLRWSKHETALEEGWLLAELEQRFGYGLDELARRFDRSTSWVSRRLALVELLPEAIQQQVREGQIGAQLAMKYLVPVARISLDDCQRMAAAFANHHWNTRQAGQLYAAWREGSPAIRQRILEQPELFLKAQRQVESNGSAAELLRDLEMVSAIVNRASRRLVGAAAPLDGNQLEQARRRIDRIQSQLHRIDEGIQPQEPVQHVEQSATNHDSGTERPRCEQARDRTDSGPLAPERAPGASVELHRRAGTAPPRESRTLPATDPRTVDHLQGEPRAGP